MSFTYDEENNSPVTNPDALSHFKQVVAAHSAGQGGPRMSMAPVPTKAMKAFSQRVWSAQDWEAIQKMDQLKWFHGKEWYDAGVFEWNGVGRPIPILGKPTLGTRGAEDVY